MAVNIGPKIGIDGEAEYRKQINNIIQSTKTLKSEYQALESTVAKSKNPFKNFAAELDNNKKKHDILSEALSKQKERLSTLQQMAGSAAEKFGENANQTLKWKQAVADAEAECGRLESQLNSIPSTLSSVGSAMKTVGSEMTAVGKELSMKVTAPLVGVATLSAKSFAEVDKTMQLTNATMANTAEEAEQLNKAMKSAAASSTFGMTDAAEATLNFARAGLNAQQAADALAPAMNLAAGEGGELTTVSAGLVATINGFGGSFTEAGSYADIFANACNNSALEVNSLSSAMSVAAPIFSAAGYSVKDAALYMGVMANAGIDADTSANSLKTGLARLVSPAAEGKKALDELGVAVTNADGSMKDSVTIQKELHDAFSGLSESQQIAAASAIFGKNQMSNWLALINTAPEDVSKLSSALAEEGTTAEMAEAMMSGFGGSMEKLKSSIDVAGVSLGEALAPAISTVAGGIQKAVDWFNSLDEEQQQTIATIGMVVAAIGPLLVIGGTLASSIGSIMTLVGTIGPALGGVATVLTGPVGLAIAGVVAAGALLIANWDTIKEGAAKLGEAISERWSAVKEKTAEAWDNVKSKVSDAITGAKEIAHNRLAEIHDAFQQNGGGIKGVVAASWEAITTQFKTGFDIADRLTGGKLSEIKDKFFNRFNELKNAALGWGRDLIGNLVSGITEGIGKVGDAASNVANAIRSRLHFTEPDEGPLADFHTYMPDMMRGLAEGMKANLGEVEAAATQVASAIATPMKATSNTINYGGFSIVINAADGQSASDIADEVEARISQKISEQEAVWA